MSNICTDAEKAYLELCLTGGFNQNSHKQLRTAILQERAGDDFITRGVRIFQAVIQAQADRTAFWDKSPYSGQDLADMWEAIEKLAVAK